MQETHPSSQSPLFFSQLFISTLSFGLMGALSGMLTGVIDAMRSSGSYVLMSSTALHLLVGCAIGLLCGLVYTLVPNSVGFGAFIKAAQDLLYPPPQVSDYQRGRVVSSIWLWALVINLVIPTASWVGMSLSAKVSTPLFSLFISIGVIVVTSISAVPLVHGISRSGGRLLAAIGAQVRHLTSAVPSALHPLLLIVSGAGGLLVFSLVFPPLLSSIKNIDNSLLSILAITSLGAAVAAIFLIGVRVLTGARFKSLISGALRLLRFGQNLTNPLLHLTLAVIYSVYHFLMWIWSDPPEWRQMQLHHAALITLFFIPLFVGGEYLRPFVRYSRKLGVLLILFAAITLGLLGVSEGLEHSRTREALYQNTVSSAVILKRVHTLFDQDGDGYASSLGERDCDDLNPDIHPGAIDIPGNDIDEDCDGLDLSSKTLEARTVLTQEQTPREKTLISRDVTAKEAAPVTLIKPLLERISGPHHIIWITLPGLMTSSIIAPNETPADASDTAQKRVKSSARRDETTEPAATPALYAFSQSALWIQNAYAPASESDLSALSLLTGHYPSELIRNTQVPMTLSRAARMLPETLKRARYQTAAFVSDAKVTRGRGYDQGFITWENRAIKPKKRRAQKTGELSELVKRLNQHLGELELGKREHAFVWLHSDELTRAIKPASDRLSDRARSQLISRNRKAYQSALAQVDSALSDLEVALTSAKTSVGSFSVVITGLNGLDLQGSAPTKLGEQALKSTLMIRSSEVKPRVVSTPTSLIKVTPTLLDLAEIETFERERELMELNHTGLMSWALGDEAADHVIYAEQLGSKNSLSARAVINHRWKLFQEIRNRSQVISERLYMLERFGETRDMKQLEEVRHQMLKSDLDKLSLNSVGAFPSLFR